MAEKKRKRLLAQQESKKNITPIVFEDKPGNENWVASFKMGLDRPVPCDYSDMHSNPFRSHFFSEPVKSVCEEERLWLDHGDAQF